MNNWPPVERIWEGETCAILASGPSMSKDQAEYVRGKCRVIVVNNTWQLAPWADILYSCDYDWWAHYRPDFKGIKISQSEKARQIFSDIIAIPSLYKVGLSRDPNFIHRGGNGGYQAINLAVLMGVRKIILLGFDVKSSRKKSHWHGNHPLGLNSPDEDNFDRWRTAFQTIIPDLALAQVELINCSRSTSLVFFKCAKLEEIL